MDGKDTPQDDTYDPDKLLDNVIKKLGLKNDAALSRTLEISPAVISKLRHRRMPVGASILLRMHEVSGISVRDLRDLLGDRRATFRMGHTQRQ